MFDFVHRGSIVGGADQELKKLGDVLIVQMLS